MADGSHGRSKLQKATEHVASIALIHQGGVQRVGHQTAWLGKSTPDGCSMLLLDRYYYTIIMIEKCGRF